VYVHQTDAFHLADLLTPGFLKRPVFSNGMQK
jgi:hypothetical protein